MTQEAPCRFRLRQLPVLLSAALMGWPLGGPAATAAQQHEEHASRPEKEAVPGGSAARQGGMQALLEEIRNRTDLENGYLGEEKTRQLRRALDQLPPETPPDQRVKLLVTLGLDELRLGNNEEAIEHLANAHRIVSSHADTLGAVAIAPYAYYLGIAHLRYAETKNCVGHHTSESCILPIRGGGVHVLQEQSRLAIRSFRETVRLAPLSSELHVAARWLLNIAYMTIGAYPDDVPEDELISPTVFASDEEFPRFVDIAPRLGLNTFDLCGGAVIEDFDGDGLLDIMTSTWDTAGQMHYFHNEGDGSFVERTEEAGLVGLLGGLNMNHTDFDNDGDADVLVLRGGWFRGPAARQPNSLLRNDGHGRFTDVTFEVGLGEVHYPTQTAAWRDYDLDGDLDLYIGNEAAGPGGFPSQLFRNDASGAEGKVRFVDVAAAAGVENRRYAKGVSWGDVNGDRYPDLYVSNMGSENRLYLNRGDGTFEDVASETGVLGPRQSFPTWFWDFDNDGAQDLFVSSYYHAMPPGRLYAVAASYLGLRHKAELPRLYRGNGRGGFVEVSKEQGLDQVTMPMGSNFGDLDNDGYLDFYLGTGYPFYDGLMPNVMYWNLRGEGFADVTTASGFGHLQKGHAVVFADLDNDGDQDVFEQMGGAFPGDAFGNALYENPGFGNHWIKVKLVGEESNRAAIGARIQVVVIEGEKPRSVYRHVTTGGSFGSNPLTQHIGVGSAARIETLEVFWPRTGATQTFSGLAVDQTVRIREGAAGYEVVPEKSFTLGP